MNSKTILIWRFCVIAFIIPHTASALLNPCAKKPCKNGGVCRPKGTKYKCSCKKGLYGKRCEYRLLGCYRDKRFRAMVKKRDVRSIEECMAICNRMGSKVAGLEYGKDCLCKGNYKKYGRAKKCYMKCRSGQICGGPSSISVYTSVNTCSRNPCKNGGVCKSKGIEYKCLCRKGLYGKRCEYRLLGCYRDKRFRAMVKKHDVRSIEECMAICNKMGSKVAALEYGKECLCKGNYKKYGHAKKCYMKCRSGQICGAPWSMSVYTSVYPCAKNPCKNGGVCKSIGTEYKCLCRKGLYGKHCEYRLLGCFRDKRFRAMTKERDVKSIEECMAICNKMGSKVAALGFGRQCFCKGNYKKYGYAKKCYMICQSGQICGGPWSMSVYTLENPCARNPCKNGRVCKSDGTEYKCLCRNGFYGKRCEYRLLGCYRDKRFRAMIKKRDVTSIEECMAICNKIGTNVAGLEFGKECLCKGNYKMYGRAKKCNMKCKSGQICGGFWTMSVYTSVNPCARNPCKNGRVCKPKGTEYTCVCRNGLYGKNCEYRLLGCYKDKRVRAMIKKRDVRSIEECMAICNKMGSKVAGLEFGKECLCKGNYKKYGRAKKCYMKCKSGQICGGPWSMSVYTSVNPCARNPCRSGRVCKPKGTKYKCSCRKGLYGKRCEYMNPCARNPCKNGRVCKSKGTGYRCLCRKGLYGKRCQYRLLGCYKLKTFSAINGAINVKSIGECMAECKRKGFKGAGLHKGKQCICIGNYKKYEDEKKCNMKCKPGEICGGYWVISVYIPASSEKAITVNPCARNPCKNGRVCKSKGTEYKCLCRKGLYGKRCEYISSRKPIRGNPCFRSPCKNGGACSRRGRTYKCACKKGFNGRRCERRAPVCVCSGSGGPHYKTFDGQWIHFIGVCKYTLAMPKKTSTLPHFSVEVKNEHRGNTCVSYTRLVDLKFNGETIRLLPGSKLRVNGELMTLPLNNYMGFSAVYSAGWIKVTTKFGVKVQFDGRHRVIVRVPGKYRNELTGICGDCNGKKDDYQTKAGVNVSRKRNKYSLIGRSYQIFGDSDKPQKNCKVVDFPPECKHKKVNACGLLSNRKGPFAKCLRKLGAAAKDYFKSCQMDACTYKKSRKILKNVMCRSYEALAKKCEELNILVNWRVIAKCRLKCPKDMVYIYKTRACQPSCSNRKPLCKAGFMEGCVCKRGTILSGDKCVPIKKCGCTFDGMYLNAGSTFLLNDCSEKIICKSGGKIQKMRGCGPNTMCVVKGGVRMCACKDGFTNINGICRKVLRPPPPVVNHEYLGPVMHMFVRVSVAFIEGKPIKKLSVKHPKDCARKCLANKLCKSFNFDELREKCELFPINAEKHTLTSGDCPYKDYYQLIESKKIVIRGATIFTCVNLEEYADVKSVAKCSENCLKHKCKAMEYSASDKDCSVTHTTRKSFGLTGDEEFVYYETLDFMPQLPLH